MRAAIKRGTQIVHDTVADPEPGPGQVLVQTLACGICGSDLHALKHGSVFAGIHRHAGVDNPMDAEQDVVFGHEFAATILDYGPGTVRRLKPGTLVTSVPQLLDESGAHFIGFSNKAVGGYAQFMLLNESLLLAVPDGLTAADAALTEPFAVGEHAVAAADLGQAAGALVVGCGPVGLAVIAALKARGFGPVIAADFASGRRALAESFGADAVVDPAKQAPHGCWQDLGVAPTIGARRLLLETGARPGRAIIFECVGTPGIIRSLIDTAPAGAQIIVVGICVSADHFLPGAAIAKEIELRFVLNHSQAEFAATLDNIAAGVIDAGLLVTCRIGLDQVAGAFAALATPDEQAKVIIEPNRL
jgi:threonine dehydrogenase-like Zn-dependent dehydrogenase